MNAATGWTTIQATNQGVGEKHDQPEKQQQQAELDTRAATIVGELAGDASPEKREELTSKAEAVLSEAKAAGIQLRAFVSSSEIPGAVSQQKPGIKPAITYSPYSEEHVEAMQTVIRESREEERQEPAPTDTMSAVPSFFKDPLGSVMHWLEKMVANMTAQVDEMAQHHAEQKMAYQNPVFAEALEREGGSLSPRTQELYTPLHQIAREFAQDSGTPSSLRFEGCEGKKAMPETKTHIAATNITTEVSRYRAKS